ncbi:MAG: sensor domain-containing diguanylate cyclase [Sneathiella sp.]|nr:sensor domain-containing diguanylate cyclase [Sneathiella sp.]
MKIPDIPADEQSRLRTLRSLNILDTPAEERFDRLTRLVKRMFDVPIALISLIDENRQWFKSSTGIDFKESPRDDSFCGHAILGNQLFIVPDATKDPRFSDNPQVLTGPCIRFYAGCPIRALDGNTLGTLCILDQIPRFFNESDLSALRDLAEMVEHEIGAIQLATLDELTGISNRQGFTALAQNRLNLCVRQRKSATLVFFDLKKFKYINNTFGHAEGDKALTIFAETMARIFRNSDVYGRIGGEQFVILLTNTSYKKATATIERFQLAIDIQNKEANKDYDISFSSGLVTIEHNNTLSIEDLLENPDTAMYQNKAH